MATAHRALTVRTKKRNRFKKWSGKTWEDYCRDIGISKPTIYRWFKHYLPDYYYTEVINETLTDGHSEKRKEEEFVCYLCGKVFNVEVWHCPRCNKHWTMDVDGCEDYGKRRVELFEVVAIGKSPAEVWDLRVALLRPKKHPKYTGPMPEPRGMLKDRHVYFAFPDQETFDLFRKYFKLAGHREYYVSKASLLISLLELLERGDIVYDKKSGKASVAFKNTFREKQK